MFEKNPSQHPAPLTLYRASAGAGKTHILTQEYLIICLKHPDIFRKILSVTFTNKATDETKSRILQALSSIKTGKNNKYQQELEKRLGSDKNLQYRSANLLRRLLHNYHYFSVSTLDSLFQRMVRTFLIELKLPSLRYALELDEDDVLSKCMEKLWRDTTKNQKLRKWLSDFCLDRMKDEKSWDIEGELHSFGKELLKENCKRHMSGHVQKTVVEYMDSVKKFKEKYVAARKESKDEVLKKTMRTVDQQLYTLGLAGHVLSHIQTYREEREVVLISDLSDLLKQITEKNLPSYVYEKIGTTYQHYFLDECQDMSGFQWEALRPLISENVSQGHQSWLVGDAKQSIYRWRGSSKNLFVKQMPQDFKAHCEEKKLSYNWRSTQDIVSFNNDLFAQYRDHAKEIMGDDEQGQIAKVYENLKQTLPPVRNKDLEKGWVELEIKSVKTSETASESQNYAYTKWLPKTLKDLLQKNVAPKDVMILVRTNDEVRRASTVLLQLGIPVVSEHLLSLSSSAAVRLLMAVLRLETTRAKNVKENNDIKKKEHNFCVILIEQEYRRLFEKKHVPEGFWRFWDSFSKLPLYEQVENHIRLLELDKLPKEFALLETFQAVLLDFQEKRGSDINEFLNFWEERKHIKGLSVPESIHAAQVLTVHKAKGLEADVVLIPYGSFERGEGGNKTDYLWQQGKDYNFPLPFFAIPYNKAKLSKTKFETCYREEKRQKELDSLNLLYVAMTRARKILRGYLPFGSKFGRGNRKLSQMIDKLAGTREILSYENDDVWHRRFSRGTCPKITKVEQVVEDENRSARDKSYYAFVKQAQLSTLFPSSHLLPQKAKESSFGIAMHELLSMLSSPKQDRKATLQQFLHGHNVAKPWKKDLAQRLNLFLDHPKAVRLCFPVKEGELLRVELTLFDEKGHAYRPDRMVLKDNTARIIDFKTGKKISPEDKKQMRIYERCLAEMGYNSSLHLCHIAEDSVSVINL